MFFRVPQNLYRCRAFSATRHRVLISALALSCLGAAWNARPAFCDTPDEQFQFATGLYDQKLWGLAADKLRDFLAANPKDARAKFAAYQLGGALYRALDDKGDINYSAAAAAYEKAIAQFPDPKLTAAARFELGDAYFNLKQYDKSVAAQTAFLATKPPADQGALAQYWLGESYAALQKTAPAQDAYQKVLAQYPTSSVAPYAGYSLGLLAADAGQKDAAIAAFDRVLKSFPDSEVAPESRLRLGDVYLSAGKYPEAIKTYRATLADAKSADWKADAQIGIADAQFAAKQWADAAPSYVSAIAALPPKDERAPALQMRLGDAYFNAKEYGRALDAYAPLQANADANIAANALYWSASSERALGQTAPAAAHFEQIMAKFPQNPLSAKAALRLGDTWADAKDPLKAAAAYQIVLTRYAQSGAATEARDALVGLVGEVARGGGKSNEFENILRGLPPGPTASNAQLRLAQAAYEGGDWKKAIELAQTAIASKPEAATAENAQYLLASAQLQDKQSAQSAASFRLQMTNFPKGELVPQAKLGLTWALLDAKQWAPAQIAGQAAVAAFAAPTQTESKGRAQLALGEALLRGDKATEAATVFAEAEKSAIKDVAAQGSYGVALSLEAQKQWGAAGASWAKYAAASTDAKAKASAFLSQGLALVQTPDKAAALPAFDSTIAADPKSETAARALSESAWVLHDTKQTEKELAAWTRLATEFPLSPLSAEAFFQRGEALFEQKKWDDAAVSYRTVGDKYPDSELNGAARYKLGSTLYNQEKWGDAATAFGAAAKSKTGDKAADVALESSFWAGESLRRAGNLASARAPYQTFIVGNNAKTPMHLRELLPAARLGLGQALEAANDGASAIPVYRAGLDGASGATATELNFRLGQSLLKSGNSKDALPLLLKVAILDPKSEWAAQSQWNAAQITEKNGDRAGALELYRKLSQSQPPSEWSAKAGEQVKALGTP